MPHRIMSVVVFFDIFTRQPRVIINHTYFQDVQFVKSELTFFLGSNFLADYLPQQHSISKLLS